VGSIRAYPTMRRQPSGKTLSTPIEAIVAPAGYNTLTYRIPDGWRVVTDLPFRIRSVVAAG